MRQSYCAGKHKFGEKAFLRSFLTRSVIPASCLPTQGYLERVKFGAIPTQRTRQEQSLSFHLQREHLHRADAALGKRPVERLERGVQGIGAPPKSEPGGVSHVLDVGDARGRAVQHPGHGQPLLQRHDQPRRPGVCLQVLGLVGLVEDDDARVRPLGAAGQPRHNFLHAPAAHEKRVGDEEHPFAQRSAGPESLPLLSVRRHHIERLGAVVHVHVASHVGEVPPRVLDKLAAHGHPEVPTASVVAAQGVEYRGRYLTPLAYPGAVADEETWEKKREWGEKRGEREEETERRTGQMRERERERDVRR